LHGEGRGALHLAAGFDITIRRTGDAKEINPSMAVEIFVFDGDEGVAKQGWEVVVSGDDAALQRERADYASTIVINFGDGTRTVRFQRVNLRQVGGVDEEQTGGGADQH
jgi:hypothetical protein